MKSILNEELFDEEGRLKVTCYELYRDTFRRMKSAATDGDMELFNNLLSAVYDLISYLDSKSLKNECESEVSAYLKQRSKLEADLLN